MFFFVFFFRVFGTLLSQLLSHLSEKSSLQHLIVSNVAKCIVVRALNRTLRSGINCAGEIRVAEDDDYEKWAIEIYVKFREGEPLTLLTGQRQSGGVSERMILAETS
jgi:hypothetical protein